MLRIVKTRYSNFRKKRREVLPDRPINKTKTDQYDISAKTPHFQKLRLKGGKNPIGKFAVRKFAISAYI